MSGAAVTCAPTAITATTTDGVIRHTPPPTALEMVGSGAAAASATRAITATEMDPVIRQLQPNRIACHGLVNGAVVTCAPAAITATGTASAI